MGRQLWPISWPTSIPPPYSHRRRVTRLAGSDELGRVAVVTTAPFLERRERSLPVSGIDELLAPRSDVGGAPRRARQLRQAAGSLHAPDDLAQPPVSVGVPVASPLAASLLLEERTPDREEVLEQGQRLHGNALHLPDRLPEGAHGVDLADRSAHCSGALRRLRDHVGRDHVLRTHRGPPRAPRRRARAGRGRSLPHRSAPAARRRSGGPRRNPFGGRPRSPCAGARRRHRGRRGRRGRSASRRCGRAPRRRARAAFHEPTPEAGRRSGTRAPRRRRHGRALSRARGFFSSHLSSSTFSIVGRSYPWWLAQR